MRTRKEMIKTEIGDKILKARKNANLTQNQLAEMLGVSRQSVSNWENNRAYPDIISVIKISDICKISLDSLLKNDEKMIKHLEESINTVKTKSKYIKIVEIVFFVIVWSVSLVVLYLTRYEYQSVVNIILYCVMPLVIIVVSTLIGNNSWGREKTFMPYVFGVMYSTLTLFEYVFIPDSIGDKHDIMYVVFNSAGPLLIWGIALSYLGILFGNKISKK